MGYPVEKMREAARVKLAQQQRVCAREGCGIEFKPDSGAQRYCSAECRTQAYEAGRAPRVRTRKTAAPAQPEDRPSSEPAWLGELRAELRAFIEEVATRAAQQAAHAAAEARVEELMESALRSLFGKRPAA